MGCFKCDACGKEHRLFGESHLEETAARANAAATVIRDDVAANEADSFSVDTVLDYLSTLRKLFVVEDLPAWCPNLRAKTPVRTTDTRHFGDPSIAAAVLALAPADLLRDLPTFGLFFETLAIRDLRAYADALDGSVRHYRDKSGLECDAVVHLRNGAFGLVEIKLGGAVLIDKGARSLSALASKLDPAKLPAPSFLLVLVADGDIAYRRPDGIIVCPVSALKP